MLKLFCLIFVLGIIFLDLCLVKSTGNDNSLARVKRIIGGQIAYKHWDTVFTISSQRGYCTGTFIAPNLILTAAQCCEDVGVSSPISIYNEKRTLKTTISKVHIESNYAKSSKRIPEDDIAVIQLYSNVDSITVAPLGYDYAISCNETVYSYGFGRTDPFNAKMSEQLKVCTGKVVQCSWFTYYKYYIPFVYHNDQLLIEGQDGIMYYGDAGGPLFNQAGSLIGVMQNLFYPLHLKLNGYSRIWKHKKFLRDILSQS